jgi:hypothetical protein
MPKQQNPRLPKIYLVHGQILHRSKKDWHADCSQSFLYIYDSSRMKQEYIRARQALRHLETVEAMRI